MNACDLGVCGQNVIICSLFRIPWLSARFPFAGQCRRHGRRRWHGYVELRERLICGDGLVAEVEVAAAAADDDHRHDGDTWKWVSDSDDDAMTEWIRNCLSRGKWERHDKQRLVLRWDTDQANNRPQMTRTKWKRRTKLSCSGYAIKNVLRMTKNKNIKKLRRSIVSVVHWPKFSWIRFSNEYYCVVFTCLGWRGRGTARRQWLSYYLTLPMMILEFLRVRLDLSTFC